MARSILEEYPDSDVSVSIVWEPMLPSDNEAAARQSSAIFDDPRVRQFWDPNRLSGIAFSRDVFPTMLRDMAGSVPDEMTMLKGLKNRADLPPESAPLWDVAFLYDKGATWNDRPAKPAHWTKQVMYYGESSGGNTGLFWRNDFAKPPFDSDWFVELTEGMKKLTGKQPAPSAARTEPDARADADTGSVVEFPDTRAGRIASAFLESYNSGDEKAVIAFSEKYRTAAALEERPMSERLEQYRSLIGDWGTFRAVSVDTRGENEITVIVRPQKVDASLQLNFELGEKPPHKLEGIRITMNYVPPKTNAGEKGESERARTDSSSSPKVTSLESSIEPLREWFNANRGKPRVITLLSPT